LHIVFTIVSRNYAAQAAALMRSLAEVDPEVHRIVVVTDGDFPAGLTSAEIVDVWALDGVTPSMALYYDALEFNTAAKPFAFRQFLLRPEVRSVTYLDPDILVFRPLDAVRAVLVTNSIAMTPHLTRPLGATGAPNDQTILQAGAYNLGFLAARPTPDALGLMEWWGEKCRFDCRVDFANGLFTDQKWMDLAPGLVDSFALLRDPGLNLAYWNLPSRLLERTGAGWVVDGRPLTFFHFSGFDPRRPDQLSRYQTHLSVQTGSPLAQLLELYARTLLEAGHARWSAVRYGHARLSSGREVSPLMRRAALHAARGGERLPRPDEQGEAWFETAFPEAPPPWRLTRLAAAWIEADGGDPRSDKTLGEALEAFRRLADASSVQAQARLERARLVIVREPLDDWPWGGAAPEASLASDDPLAFLRRDDPEGVPNAVSALWRCRADLRTRLARTDPDLVAVCLGPEALAGRFAPSLLGPERLATLRLEPGGLAERAGRLALGSADGGDIREIQILFGVAPRANWPLSADLRARRERWEARDRATGLPVLLTTLWASRPDLRRLDLRRWLDRIRFLRWFASIGVVEYGLSAAALPRGVRNSLAFRSAWRSERKPALESETTELRIVEHAPDPASPEICFVAESESFVLRGRPCPAPARARRVIVETTPGAAAADLIGLRARGILFDVVEARWSAEVIQALAADDPVRSLIPVIRSL
jgi:hypothetical protein